MSKRTKATVPKNWYIDCMKLTVRNDLEKRIGLRKFLGRYENKFINWCAIQRVIYEANIFSEIREFKEDILNKRLYRKDIKLWHKIRKEIFERDNFVCQYCGKIGGILEIDHIIPMSKGGTNELSNLTTSCKQCNRKKRNKLIEEFLKI